MRILKIIPCFLLLLLAFTNRLAAQTLELGVHGGVAGYIGDLNQDNPVKVSGMSVGGFAKMNFDGYWGLGLHYTHGVIAGNDENSSNAQFRARNINFRTPLNEVLLRVDFNFFDYFSGGGTKKFSPYVFTGVGGVLFKPTARYNAETYKVHDYKTEGQANEYKNYALTIPYGLGIKYRVNSNVSVFTELGYRTSNTDYLDDVSGKYPTDPVSAFMTGQALTNPSTDPRVGQAGTMRGDYRKRDTYMFMSIGFSFAFLSEDCYKF